ncbi:hypothetical protein [Arsenicicoccus dermatophilus]|uniref:hypothetical protein n=1 Tax=Arsenicicoccus dermatophilus TaxID=1076331 RepID=UPI003917052C
MKPSSVLGMVSAALLVSLSVGCSTPQQEPQPPQSEATVAPEQTPSSTNMGSAPASVKAWFASNCPTVVEIDPNSNAPFLVQGAVRLPDNFGDVDLYKLDKSDMSVAVYRKAKPQEWFCIRRSVPDVTGKDKKYTPPSTGQYMKLTGPDTEVESYVSSLLPEPYVKLTQDASAEVSETSSRWVLDPASFPMQDALKNAKTAPECQLESCGG